MSGPIGSSQWMYSSSTSFFSHTIDQSLRFNDDDSAYLSRLPSSASNQRTWTWSAWVKRGNVGLGARATLFSGRTTGTSNLFGFLNPTSNGAADTFGAYMSADGDDRFQTTRVFRDPNAWYHFVVVLDTTQGSNDDRFKLYVNGIQETTWTRFDTITQNSQKGFNEAISHSIGAEGTGQLFDGYMAEVNFIDGTALSPTSFGETKDGIWIPKAYSGSYGTNGFHLSYKSSDLNTTGSSRTDPYGSGTDQPDDTFADNSGSGNHWTISGLVASDVVPDSPTNNFATFNPLLPNANVYSEGNLKNASAGNDWEIQVATMFPAGISGKWYAEFYVHTCNASSTRVGVGVTGTNVDPEEYLGNESPDVAYYDINDIYTGGSKTADTDATFAAGDIISVSLNLDDGEVTFRKNNSTMSNGTQSLVASTLYTFATTNYGSGAGVVANFGQDDTFAGNKTSGSAASADGNGIGDFYYAPPSGFVALCTSNLQDITIGPGQTSQADDYFDTILYTAASSNGTHTHGSISFTPDWSWIKNRDNSERHFLTDVVRGNVSVTDKFLVSSDASAEGANGVSGTTFSVTSSGYQFVESSIDSGELYYNSRTYVGWNWKAGGAPTSDNSNAAGAEPTAGSVKIDGVNKSGAFSGSPDIPVTRLSASTEAGFSIVKYAGVTANPIKVPHGLTSAPELLIIKRLDGGDSWMVGEPTLGFTSSNILRLEESSVVPLGNVVFTASPDTNVFTVGSATNVNANTSPYIAYCFHSVEGYSKVGGSYIGGGSNLPFVYIGFRPAFVLLKVSSTTNSWFIYDNKREGYNQENDTLSPDLTAVEDNSYKLDLLSNGFKIRGTNNAHNQSGQTFIYLAFAEQPLKFANAR
tara:strand:- start:5290 stop:7887 length:2598 start_codon:yes stop_codon:yes gene_type:complete